MRMVIVGACLLLFACARPSALPGTPARPDVSQEVSPVGTPPAPSTNAVAEVTPAEIVPINENVAPSPTDLLREAILATGYAHYDGRIDRLETASEGGKPEYAIFTNGVAVAIEPDGESYRVVGGESPEGDCILVSRNFLTMIRLIPFRDPDSRDCALVLVSDLAVARQKLVCGCWLAKESETFESIGVALFGEAEEVADLATLFWRRSAGEFAFLDRHPSANYDGYSRWKVDDQGVFNWSDYTVLFAFLTSDGRPGIAYSEEGGEGHSIAVAVTNDGVLTDVARTYFYFQMH
jgi:hypothetical protein